MARMTRTQITLEEDEYLFLKAESAETGESLSSVVRGLIRARMARSPERVLHVWELAGIAGAAEDGPEPTHAGWEFDKMLGDAIADWEHPESR